MKIEIDNNKIIIPDGYIVKQEDNVIYLEPNNEDEGVKRWEELLCGKMEGAYIDIDSSFVKAHVSEATYRDRNVARTKAHCKSMLAMAQISQLKPYYGGDITEEELNNANPFYGIYWSAKFKKFCITIYRELVSTLLTFHSKEQAEEFIKYNKDLLMDYFMIGTDDEEFEDEVNDKEG